RRVAELCAPVHVLRGTKADRHRGGEEGLAGEVLRAHDGSCRRDLAIAVESRKENGRELKRAHGAGGNVCKLDFLVAPARDVDGDAGAEQFTAGIGDGDCDGSELAIARLLQRSIVGKGGKDLAIHASANSEDRLQLRRSPGWRNGGFINTQAGGGKWDGWRHHDEDSHTNADPCGKTRAHNSSVVQS